MKRLLALLLFIPSLALASPARTNEAGTTLYQANGSVGQLAMDSKGRLMSVMALHSSTTTGTIDMTSASSRVTFDCTNYAAVRWNFTRTSQTGTIKGQVSMDASTWTDSPLLQSELGNSNLGFSAQTSFIVSNGSREGIIDCAGWKYISLAVSSTGSGSLPVTFVGSASQPMVVRSIRPGWTAAELGKREDDAHSSADTGVAMLIRRKDSTATSAGSDQDYATPDADSDGRLYVNGFGAGVGQWFQACGTATSTTSDTAIKAAVASNRHYIAGFTCKNTSTTVATPIDFKDGSTTIAVGAVSQTTTASGGAFHARFSPPLRGTVNTAINFATNVSTNAVTCCAHGFISGN